MHVAPEQLDDVERIARAALARLGTEGIDDDQELAWRLAHVVSALGAVRALVDDPAVPQALASYGAALFLREAASELVALGVIDDLGALPLPPRPSEAAAAEVAEAPTTWSLGADLDLARDTFGRFARDEIAPVADEVHRRNLDVPERIIEGLAGLGAFGLSIPERYGGSATGSVDDTLAMLVATEALSQASLGIGGSLITRPEIIARAILAGGTEEQRVRYLPALASGELMGAVAVTEPDYGSDVASITTQAILGPDTATVRGTKTWCTFAGRANLLAVLARTEPDPSLRHRGLSLLLVPKDPVPGHSFDLEIGGGRLTGRAIDTLGYRGMHSYEVAFDDVSVAREQIVGGEEGRGRGFYLQMAGFENGRLQTVARAVGLMDAALAQARAYVANRRVFGRSLADYTLTRRKLARMVATVAAARAAAYRTARHLETPEGSLAASMAKAWSCRQAELVTREAQQLHGGMGYAEEYPVSRYFVDARVLSIFEGADETLSLRVIARAVASSSETTR
ncbi:acyl-CoA dehydrogenase domain protein [Acidimicrobium ferrooxidans DSM 10331]|uniref:Acyl-CoA dehydrogenase domain protein n=1 Tax=Acidimicrobium ferrooxidans (strain DSM 10331 / JCM 15462 / NBRC 103882 / ICP) TaxID=525909 RepID=C7M136_ACIFD|nr:acyl-CoA dehydrogenase family protein [Acidimicrobium ferrooxidans]ACU54684.1 acyl-CoA dehydrogenase domain protein [Acidimicrobium ferrooxidans DSM 10331]